MLRDIHLPVGKGEGIIKLIALLYFVIHHIGNYSGGIEISTVLRWWLRRGPWKMAGLGYFFENCICKVLFCYF